MADNKVTVDTGLDTDIYRGALVTWLHVPRGGYGFSIPVPAKVEKVTRSVVTILVQTKAKRTVRRHVAPHALRWTRA